MQSDTQALLIQYGATRDTALRNQLAEHYEYLCGAVASRFLGRGAEEDLRQVAALALLSAIERFDGDRGLSFTTYAVATLTGAVRNHLRDRAALVRPPRQGMERMARIQRETEAFYKAHGREPTVMELSHSLGLRPDDVLDALEIGRHGGVASLDEPADHEDGDALGSLLGTEEEGYDQVEKRDLAERLLQGLDEKSRKILMALYLKGQSQRDVAKAMGMSQMQVSRLSRRAIKALRDQMGMGG